jgi:3-deoxy-D-manno-octulosonate 8-phosphate phosphatase (KDO 8-P phosphatase)
MDNVLEKAAKIELFIFDIDGVLTDGKLYLSEHQEVMKTFHVHDGVGIKMLQEAGIKVAIITGSTSPIVQLRANYLNIKYVHQGSEDKIPAYNTLLAELDLKEEKVAYLGDDLPDLPLMRRAGLSIAVANATTFVREHANFVTKAHGGNGAAREACELILRAKGLLDFIHQRYL